MSIASVRPEIGPKVKAVVDVVGEVAAVAVVVVVTIPIIVHRLTQAPRNRGLAGKEIDSVIFGSVSL